jgi:hypothetical protein
MLDSYYKFAALSDEVMQAHKIRSKQRIDCIAHAHAKESYKGLMPFQNTKGHLALYKIPARDIVTANSKRIAEWSLSNGNLNLSSIYIEDMDCPLVGYGYPNSNPRLGNGNRNPLFEFRNDGYLFVLNSDYSEIEVLIIKDGRNLIGSYYQMMIDGAFDEQLQKLRGQAEPFFLYEGLGL